MAKNDKFAKAIAEAIRKKIVSGLQKSALLVERSAKQLAPTGKSGELGASIKSFVDPITLEAYVYTDVKYAPFVEYMTKPHIIEPKEAKALTIPKFGGRIVKRTEGGKEVSKTSFKFGGKTKIDNVVFTKRVMHPGTDAQPFMRPALDNNRENIKKILINEINSIRK